MSKFEQFFSSNKLMIASMVIALIAFAGSIVISGISILSNMDNIFYCVFNVIMFFIALTMYRSFAKHETNAMNIVTGAAIGLLLLHQVELCVSSIALYPEEPALSALNINIIASVLFAILFINHVQINSIHRNTRGRIILNQVILIAIAAYSIYIIVAALVQIIYQPEMILSVIYPVLFCLAKVFISIMIICIETKLNAYKIDRDAAKAEGVWTDEKKAETKEKYFGK